jgi:ArsR family transcriptional regulator
MSVDMDCRTDVVRAVGEPVRWRIVELLSAEELCVCHLVDELQVSQPVVSHHLRVLRDAGVVESERYRYWTYYRLRPEGLESLVDDLGRLVGRARNGGRRRRACG